MSSQDNDQDTRAVAIVLISAILLAVGLAVGAGIQKSRAGAGPSAAATPAPAAEASAAPATAAVAAPVGAAADDDDASIVVENGVVKFYFASGKADLAPGAAEALSDAVAAAKAGKKLVLSGFHDATGNPAMNAELAKKRALALRDALVAVGVAESSIVMSKPEQTTGSGDDAQARRVEVEIVD
ncbi:MAG: OmpA family protein [Hydrogenophaga sp.]